MFSFLAAIWRQVQVDEHRVRGEMPTNNDQLSGSLLFIFFVDFIPLGNWILWHSFELRGNACRCAATRFHVPH